MPERSAFPAAGVVVMVFALLSTTSCRQILEIEPRAVSTGDGGAAEAVALAVCGLPSAGPTAACGQCMNEACCLQAQGCVDREDCRALEACVRACGSGDAVCRAACDGTGSVALLQKLVEDCRATYCADACRSGPWECLGHVTWSRRGSTDPSSRTMIISTAVDDENRGPISGATVRLCSLVDPMCLLPLAEGQTGDAGVATLVLDTSTHVPPLSVFLDYHKDGLQDLVVLFNTPPLVEAPPVFALGGRPGFDGVAVVLHADGHWSDLGTGTTHDPTRAQALVFVRDCNNEPAGRDQELRGVLVVTWLDRDGQTSTTMDLANGSALAANLPVDPSAGITRVVAWEASSQRFIGTANLVVRSDTLTITSLAPTP
jgi:hypothetical protein